MQKQANMIAKCRLLKDWKQWLLLFTPARVSFPSGPSTTRRKRQSWIFLLVRVMLHGKWSWITWTCEVARVGIYLWTAQKFSLDDQRDTERCQGAVQAASSSDSRGARVLPEEPCLPLQPCDASHEGFGQAKARPSVQEWDAVCSYTCIMNAVQIEMLDYFKAPLIRR